MLRSVGLKTLFDQRRALAAWTISLVLLVAMYVAIWPSFGGDAKTSYGDVINEMPEALRALFAASGADMSSPAGYIQVELLSFMGPMLVLIYAINAGAAAVAGEEDRHTLDLLLSSPVSRARVVLEKLAAMATGVVLMALMMGATLLAFGPLADMRLPVVGVTAAMLHMALLGMVFGGLALAVGAASGHVAASRAVPAIVAVVAYIVNGLATVVSWLEPAQKASPFYQYIGHDPMHNGVSVAAVAVALVTTACLAAIAVWGFRRRDVAA